MMHAPLTQTQTAAKTVSAGYLALDADGEKLTDAFISRETLIAMMTKGDIECVARVLWLDPSQGRVEDRTAAIAQEIYDAEFWPNLGERIPEHLFALYELAGPKGFDVLRDRYAQ